MNLLEALNTAMKDDRNIICTGAFSCKNNSMSPGKFSCRIMLNMLADLTVSSILDDCWNVEEKEVTITKSKFLEAYTNSMEDYLRIRRISNIYGYTYNEFHEIINGLIKHLGLEK